MEYCVAKDRPGGACFSNQPTSQGVEDADERLFYLTRYGRGSLAYSTLQEGLNCFMSQGSGYLAYGLVGACGPSAVVLSDPLACPENKQQIVQEFLGHFENPIFLHINSCTAKALEKLGFYINELGVETILDVQDFDLVGNRKQHLRRARNCGDRDGLLVRELGADAVQADALSKISDDWVSQKQVDFQELRFLARPAVYADEKDVRKFYAFKDGLLVAFVFFDPIYENGQVVGYIANTLRSNLRRSYSVTDYIILQALQIFKSEGIKEVSLGLSPLADINDQGQFRFNPFLKAQFLFCFNHANFIYSFKNVAMHKKRYRPDMPGAREQKVYCATRTILPFLDMYRAFCLIGMNPVAQAADHLRDALSARIKSMVRPVLNKKQSCA